MNEGGALAAGMAVASAPGNPGHCSQEGFGPKPGITNVAVPRAEGGREGGPKQGQRGEAGLPAARIYGSNGCSTQFLLRVKVKKRLSHH